mmetsp:Transcript_2086/g.4215  ORF Transcript_2086/g.4215 Transcript_2086/m.4215 type:complete len:220 (-) Transcript_2086:384-1043(-)
MAAISMTMMPTMMSLFCTARRDMEVSTLRARPTASSASCRFSRAPTMVSRWRCRSCRMLTPSSSVSSSVCRPCVMRSPVARTRCVADSSASRCAEAELELPSPSSARLSSSTRIASSSVELYACLTSRFSFVRSALYSRSFASRGDFTPRGKLLASKSIRRTSASASAMSASTSCTFGCFSAAERVASVCVFRAIPVDSSQYSRSYPSNIPLIASKVTE